MGKTKKDSRQSGDLRRTITETGRTIAGWARANGWSVHTVRSALAGKRVSGVKSATIRKAAKNLI